MWQPVEPLPGHQGRCFGRDGTWFMQESPAGWEFFRKHNDDSFARIGVAASGVNSMTPERALTFAENSIADELNRNPSGA